MEDADINKDEVASSLVRNVRGVWFFAFDSAGRGRAMRCLSVARSSNVGIGGGGRCCLRGGRDGEGGGGGGWTCRWMRIRSNG